eukprot:TRINITY_DN9603_c0_g1_i6.p1 TRINITY_DN9603_c0_g1~~TRINITY_DN9603_c0_g1_i6.p1  ORF type:complete len:188 (+),score=28.51 TRINITY_DN9603_c0_g1_i6:711-1274(+)
MTLKAKVAIVGPCETGKSVLSNFLADAIADGRTAAYRPTKGCRILEFELDGHSGSRTDTHVELWDVSGDTSAEANWGAITSHLHGLMIVFDINKDGQEANLDVWFRRFIKKAGIKSSQCIVVANNPSTSSPERTSVTLQGPLSKAKLVYADINTKPDAFRQAFNTLMENVRDVVVQQRDAIESKLLS